MVARDYAAIRTVEDAYALAKKLLKDKRLVGFDVETGYDGPDWENRSLDVNHPDQYVVGFSITNDPSWARYLPLRHEYAEENLDPVTIWEIFRYVLEKLPIVAHHKKFEDRNLLMLAEKGDAKAPIQTQLGHDTMLEAYVLAKWRSSRGEYGLKYLTKDVLGVDQAEIYSLYGEKLTGKKKKALRFNTLPVSPEVVAYACDDAALALELHAGLLDMLAREPVNRQRIYEYEREISALMAHVENYGIAVDWEGVETAHAMYPGFRTRMESYVKDGLWEMTAQAKDESLSLEAKEEARLNVQKLNLGSPVQMRKLLYTDMGLHTTRRTDKGELSTDAIALERLAQQNVAVRKFLQFKEVDNLGRRMKKWLVEYRSHDERVHPSFKQVDVRTGRFSAADPAIQQLPKKWYWDLDNLTPDTGGVNGEDFWTGNFRDFIIAAPGHYLLTFDYSQVELRILAGSSKEQRLLEAFSNGEDVHTLTAAMMLNKTPEEVDPEKDRPVGKTMNFAILYGMGHDSLGERLGISESRALELYENYFKQFSSITTWMAKTKHKADKNGYVETPFGRKVMLWDLFSENFSVRSAEQRAAINYPIQGGAADYMKISMIRAKNALQKAGLWGNGVMLIMNQHDSLSFECRNDIDPNELRVLLNEAVQWELKNYPPIVADWELGQRWGSSDEWKDDQKAVWDAAEGVWKVAEADAVSDPQEAPEEPQEEPEPNSEEEGDPGTFSHCGDTSSHEPHSHSFAMNEGEYRDVWCNGTPRGSKFLSVVPDPPEDEPAVEEEQVLRVAVREQPTKESLIKFAKLLKSHPGTRTVALDMPQGTLNLELTTSLGVEDAGSISLALGGATVSVPETNVDMDALSGSLDL